MREWGLLFIEGQELLIALASLVEKHGLQQLHHLGSVAGAHGLSCSKACGIFPDQGSNPCLLHCQTDSYPLYHWGSPDAPLGGAIFLTFFCNCFFFFFPFAATLKRVQGCLFSFKINVVLYNKKTFFPPQNE